jgi:Cu(I)/Ag(I) efflux system protein CusF
MKTWITAATLLCAAITVHAQAYEGEVRKIEKAQGRITLRHGELKGLDMPPMTMVFRVKDAQMLDTLAVGDKVRFDADKIAGAYTVTAIRKTP